ncbi:DUF3168 domain-containing protein [Acinetobacter haemolyticus]|uniref:DUF3168 domain-containing protein n=1 Tax=Acinetobacter haemolyticus TaxID=29430 RepID=UPI000E57B4C9|nr:DUF3168 domain-containing protein [Acinetobacter haemolyticus]QDJ91875.1 DUF3168 domain-containing protein [Acinetobacter haemolyticus]
MSFLPIIRLLNDSPEVRAVLGDDLRVYEDVAPLGTEPPYAVFQAIGGAAINHLDEPANFDEVMYQIIIYDTDAKLAYQIKDLVLSILEHRSYILNPMINSFETNTKLYGRGFDANWHLPR